MMKKLFLLLAFAGFGLLTTGFSPDNLLIDYFKVRSLGDRILLEWKSSGESGLVQFDLERKKDNQTDFEVIKTFSPQGEGTVYQFIDLGLYKSQGNTVTYRLKMVSRAGTTFLEGSGVYTTTSVRKTWGSIKAMFK